MIEPLDIIREDYLVNLKVDAYHSVLNKEEFHINGADIALCISAQPLYSKAHRIMRRTRRKKSQVSAILMEPLDD